MQVSFGRTKKRIQQKVVFLFILKHQIQDTSITNASYFGIIAFFFQQNFDPNLGFIQLFFKEKGLCKTKSHRHSPVSIQKCFLSFPKIDHFWFQLNNVLKTFCFHPIMRHIVVIQLLHNDFKKSP